MTEEQGPEKEEEQDWLPEETKKKVAQRVQPDYQILSGHCESCQ